MTLTALPVDSAERLQRMRIIRNVTRAGYARFNGRISAAEQTRWWEDNHGDLRAWLYANDTTEIVGFGLLTRRTTDSWWATAGVLPGHRGSSHGRAIMADLVSKADGPVYSAARKDNVAALRLHTDQAWEVISEDERLFFFKARAVVTA